MDTGILWQIISFRKGSVILAFEGEDTGSKFSLRKVGKLGVTRFVCCDNCEDINPEKVRFTLASQPLTQPIFQLHPITLHPYCIHTLSVLHPFSTFSFAIFTMDSKEVRVISASEVLLKLKLAPL